MLESFFFYVPVLVRLLLSINKCLNHFASGTFKIKRAQDLRSFLKKENCENCCANKAFTTPACFSHEVKLSTCVAS